MKFWERAAEHLPSFSFWLKIVTMKKAYWLVAAILLAFYAASASAQTSKQPAVSTVVAELDKSLDSKTALIGDEFTLRTIKSVVVDGQIVIPKGSRLLGRVGGVVNKGKSESETKLVVIVDKAALAGEVVLPVQAIIVATAAPEKSLDSDPTYAMMHSNEPKMSGSARTASSSGTLPPSSKANSNAAVATAEIKGKLEERVRLTEESQGVFGYEGINITWYLAMPPPLTIFATKSKQLKLEPGTQMLIRMAQPRIPR
jgi:hypothetical protein